MGIRLTQVQLNCDPDGTPRCHCCDERMVRQADTWSCALGRELRQALAETADAITRDAVPPPALRRVGGRLLHGSIMSSYDPGHDCDPPPGTPVPVVGRGGARA